MRDSPGNSRLWSQAALGTAVAAGVFCLAVCAAMVGHVLGKDRFLRKGQAELVGTRELAELKARLARRPDDEELKEHIRRLDLKLREAYLKDRWRVETGAWLLLVGAGVALAAARIARHLRGRLPHPEAREDDPDAGDARRSRGRWLVAAAGVIVGAAAGWLALRSDDVLARPLPVEIDWHAEAKRQWPGFRGPGGRGVSPHADVPLSFDAATGRGILWKTPVPLPGNSSPVVWAKRVFLTGATKEKREVYCFDADSGKLLWQQPVAVGRGTKAPEVMQDTGFAAPTPATDGRRVFAIFANGDLACLDFSKKVVWSRNLGVPENAYGHASSLRVHRELLIVQYDQGSDAEEGKSELIAFDAASGKVAWTAPRPVPNSWASPIVADTPAGERIVAAGGAWVIAYRPDTGRELWRAKVIGGEVGASPTAEGGVVFAANIGEYVAAVRTGGSGDVTLTHVAWKGEQGLPDIASPLADGKRVYLLQTEGLLTCYDAAKGKVLWDHDFEAIFRASPSLVGDKVLIVGDKSSKQAGRVWIVSAADAFRQLGTASVGESVAASPAFAPGRMYIRGEKHLFCIGGKQPPG